ncbi:MAG: sigma-70 family RNA polymerase sigma factor [Clostridiales bacterium]|nr:sigma-70 family RNA polymerase sigma factor [Clostridiales bacterium]
MNLQPKTQEDIQKIFDSYCKKVLRNEANDAFDSIKVKHLLEVEEFFISDISHKGEKCFSNYDNYFSEDNTEDEEKMFSVAGKLISSKVINEAVHSLPKDKQDIIQKYYYADMTDLEIANLFNLSNSTIQRYRQKGIAKLKEYLEEVLNEKTKK